MRRHVSLSPSLPPVCRLGLATRGNTRLAPADVRRALDCGINYLNWCGHEDALSETIAHLSPRDREGVVLTAQFSARRREDARHELDGLLHTLKCEFVDVLTFYYVESDEEWQQIIGPKGALDHLVQARKRGQVRLLGLTTHQRHLAARWLESGLLDLIMVRYNAAHRGAEQDVLPPARRLGLPVVAFTCTRWGGLLKSTPLDPPGWSPPEALEWYRFVLSHPDIAVALAAPHNRPQLEQLLPLLDDWRPLESHFLEAMKAHGDRVRRHGRPFP